MHSKSVRIHSDGFGQGSLVIDEDGKKVENVSSATVWISAGEPTRVDLEIWMPVVNASGIVQSITFICPCCDETITHECEGNTLGGGP